MTMTDYVFKCSTTGDCDCDLRFANKVTRFSRMVLIHSINLKMFTLEFRLNGLFLDKFKFKENHFRFFILFRSVLVLTIVVDLFF